MSSFRDSTSTYAGLDRFARTVDQYWDGYGSTSDVDRFKYAYDYAGNRTYRDIDSAIYATNNKDQAYTYDNLHRLVTSDQGTLSGTTISGTPVREEDFTLDALGNWSTYLTKAAGVTDLNQSRTHNDVNEITQIAGSSTYIGHDSAGNTVKAPKPSSWSAAYTFVFDAWNRLVTVKDGANTVLALTYDGRNYRITKAVYTAGSLSFTDHTYYNDDWQALEVRREISGTEDTDPREQFVWHPFYIDALAVRYYDSDTDANLAELSDGTHYYTHDANSNVTAIANASGTVLERYQYDPYGRLTVLDANFATDGDGLSDVDNGTTYTERLFDAESGRYYFRNRYYDPVTGRFLSRDPLDYSDGLNLFAFLGCRPTTLVDPSGTAGWYRCTGCTTLFSVPPPPVIITPPIFPFPPFPMPIPTPPSCPPIPILCSCPPGACVRMFCLPTIIFGPCLFAPGATVLPTPFFGCSAVIVTPIF
ncbi:MAG: RHS repeat-associated core domain-containing protein [Planctomycetaceae bacterium]